MGNISDEFGVCTFLEIWIGKPILWCACRRHILELHIGKVNEEVFGSIKSPGMALFNVW